MRERKGVAVETLRGRGKPAAREAVPAAQAGPSRRPSWQNR